MGVLNVQAMLRDMESIVGLRALVGGVALCAFQVDSATLNFPHDFVLAINDLVPFNSIIQV
jgi:hypothetical protein